MLKAFAGGLFGARTGAGPAWLLALHGWGRASSDYAAVLGAGGDREEGGRQPLDAVAVDLPGFGAAPPPPEAWGSAEYARAVLPALAGLVAEAGRPLVLMGHSFGGQVAVALADAAPELVGGMVLAGVPRLVPQAPSRKPSMSFRVAKAAGRLGLLGDASMERVRQRHGSADYRRAEGVMRATLVRLVNEDLSPQLGRLAGPVRLVWGALDSEVPVSVARGAERLLGGRGTLEVLEGVGHQVPAEAPAALRAAVLALRPR